MAYFKSVWQMIESMSPYLFFGLIFAGVMHIFLPKDFIYKKLSKSGLRTVFKASLLGVPMPLCSCSVIPVAQHIHKSGASRGATLSFVASTPSTGVDSITALWGLLGPVYTAFKVILAFLSGWIVGFLVQPSAQENSNLNSRDQAAKSIVHQDIEMKLPKKSLFYLVKEALTYAFDDLFKDFAKWLFLGTLLGASLEFVLPQGFGLQENIWLSYLVIVLFSMPLYVCATGSIPIALGLLSQGFSPGAALLFLTLGPITNTATVTWLWGSFGARVTTIYFGSIAFLGVIAAVIMDSFFKDLVSSQVHQHMHENFSWFTLVISILFCLIWSYHLIKLTLRYLNKKFFRSSQLPVHESCCNDSDCHTNPKDSSEKLSPHTEMVYLPIEGMTCANCQEKVESLLKSQKIDAQVDLENHQLILRKMDKEKLRGASMMFAMKGYPIKF